MYILTDIKFLPNHKFLYEENFTYKDVIEIFSTRACTVEHSDPPKSLICDRLFDDEELIEMLNTIINDRTIETLITPQDLKLVKQRMRKIMPQIIDTLNSVLFENKNWHFAQEAGVTVPKVLKSFVPVFYRDGEDIWVEMAILLFNDEKKAEALFFDAFRIYFEEDVKKFTEGGKITLFGKKTSFEREVLYSYLQFHKIDIITYHQNPQKAIPPTSHKDFPLCIGFYENYTRIMIYHGPFGDPVSQPDTSSEPVASDQTNQLPPLVPSYREGFVFGRKMRIADEPVLVNSSVLHDLSKLVSDYEQQLQYYGLVLFTITDMGDTTFEVDGKVGVAFGIQQNINLKKRKPKNGPFLLLDAHDKVNIPLNQVAKISHQIDKDEQIITEDESGLHKLMNLGKKNKFRYYLYSKGEPGWYSSVWSEHAKIFSSIYNDFLINLYLTRGVNIPYLYTSGGVSFFHIHSEDGNLKSLNICVGGSGYKYWFFIPRRQFKEFRKWFIGYLKDTHQIPVYCPNFVQHKSAWVWPKDIPPQFDITFVCQKKGDFVLVDSAAHHQGFNTGPNISYAFNFATKDWIPTYSWQTICKMNHHTPQEKVNISLNDNDRKIVRYLEVFPTEEPKYDAYANRHISDNIQDSSCDTLVDAVTILTYINHFEPFETKLVLGPLYGNNQPETDDELRESFPLATKVSSPKPEHHDASTMSMELDLAENVTEMNVSMEHHSANMQETQQPETSDQKSDESSNGSESNADLQEHHAVEKEHDESNEEEEQESGSDEGNSSGQEEDKTDYEDEKGQELDDKDEEAGQSLDETEYIVTRVEKPKKTRKGRKPQAYLQHCEQSHLELSPAVYKCNYCVQKPFSTYRGVEFANHYNRVHHSVQCTTCQRWYSQRNFGQHKKQAEFIDQCKDGKPTKSTHHSSISDRDELNAIIDQGRGIFRSNRKLTPEEKAAKMAERSAKANKVAKAKRAEKRKALEGNSGGETKAKSRKRKALEISESDVDDNVDE